MTATDGTRMVEDVAQRQAESRARLAEIKAQVERELWAQQATAARPAPVYQPAPPAPAPRWTPVYEPFQQVVYHPLPTAPAQRRRSMLGGLRCGWLLAKLLIGFSVLYVMAMAAFVQAVAG